MAEPHGEDAELSDSGSFDDVVSGDMCDNGDWQTDPDDADEQQVDLEEAAEQGPGLARSGPEMSAKDMLAQMAFALHRTERALTEPPRWLGDPITLQQLLSAEAVLQQLVHNLKTTPDTPLAQMTLGTDLDDEDDAAFRCSGETVWTQTLPWFLHAVSAIYWHVQHVGTQRGPYSRELMKTAFGAWEGAQLHRLRVGGRTLRCLARECLAPNVPAH